jgi:hypothetical protein
VESFFLLQVECFFLCNLTDRYNNRGVVVAIPN